MPKVSVIVPVYGVEKYIERCARSLFEQTLDDMEFIFVDDCTKDNSIQVLEKVITDFPNRKEQIKILHHEHNKGLSHARETGVNAASGEYIAHCDSDDWVHRDMYEELYNEAKKIGTDIVKCGYYISSDIDTPVLIYYSNLIQQQSEVLSLLFSWKGWNQIWVLLVKKNLYNNVVFTDSSMMEDFFLVAQLYANCRSVGVYNKPLYYYFQNPNSICGKTSDEAIIQRGLQACENVETVLSLLSPTLTEPLSKEIVRLKYEAQSRLIPSLHSYANYKYFNLIFPEARCAIFANPYINIKEKIQYFLIILKVYPILKYIKNFLICG